MKYSKKSVHSKTRKILWPEFEDQRLSSFSGIVIFQALFSRINLRDRLASCFKHIISSSIYGKNIIVLLLIVHFIIGFRRLRDLDCYKDDPMIQRALGLKKLPNVATVSRELSTHDEKSVSNLQGLSQDIVLDRVQTEKLSRITLDFDGTVQSTTRRAEGTAVGYNKKKKGARSYYPLLCTVAQTSQVLNFYHRPGNVHDSHGARDFMLKNISAIQARLPKSVIELRADSAFFSEEIIEALNKSGVEFTASVPFARFTELKSLIENRQRWEKLNNEISYFETDWKPACWNNCYRFLFIRTKTKIQQKGIVQFDLFEPYEDGYEFKVIVTNKSGKMKNILNFHSGRGSQEGLIGELKTGAQCDLIPVRKKCGNQIFFTSGILAHNLGRELQMGTLEKQRNTTTKRAALWKFKKLNTIGSKLIRCAGRLTRPQGKLKLTINKNRLIMDEFSRIREILDKAA
jgi:Transposase DDE domain group 1